MTREDSGWRTSLHDHHDDDDDTIMVESPRTRKLLVPYPSDVPMNESSSMSPRRVTDEHLGAKQVSHLSLDGLSTLAASRAASETKEIEEINDYEKQLIPPVYPKTPVATLGTAAVSSSSETTSARRVSTGDDMSKNGNGEATPNPIQSPPFSLFSPPASVNNKAATPNNLDLVDWKREYQVLREAMRRQQGRLLRMERENQQLRAKVVRMETEKLKKELNHHQDDPHMNNSSPPRTAVEPTNYSSSPWKDDDDDDVHYPSSARNEYSPGTKFVAELSQLIDLDVGQHALLASIMDRTSSKQQQR